jgi:hypothetical protein
MDRLILAAPALVPLAGVLAVGIWTVAHSICGHRTRIPAADDNKPGTNADDLWACRRINALPSAQPRKEKP